VTTTETVPSPTRCNVMLHLEPGSPRHKSLISLAEAESQHARPSMEISSSPTKSKPSEGDPAKCQPEKCQSQSASVSNQELYLREHTQAYRARVQGPERRRLLPGTTWDMHATAEAEKNATRKPRPTCAFAPFPLPQPLCTRISSQSLARASSCRVDLKAAT
jgi:hypothetical protein